MREPVPPPASFALDDTIDSASAPVRSMIALVAPAPAAWYSLMSCIGSVAPARLKPSRFPLIMYVFATFPLKTLP